MLLSNADFYHIDNLMKIMRNIENMGKLKDGYYSPEIQEMSKELLRLRKEMKGMPIKERTDIADVISDMKSEMTEKKRIEIEETAKEIGNGNADYSITVTKIKGHDTFIANDLNAVIISQIIKQELRRSYKIEPSNMDMIIEQIISLIDNPMPKIIIRADICHFFESIPQKSLINKLAEDGFISRRTLKYLKGILFKCNDLTKNDSAIGVPRGLAFSSYLSELYMKTVDAAISKMDGVYFYTRYVDDIIIVADPSKAKMEEYWDNVDALLKNRHLQLHNDSEKKFMAVLCEGTAHIHFDYLGYRFIYESGSLFVEMSEKRFTKYQILTDAIFDIYSKCSHYRTGKDGNRKKMRRDALHQLITRIRTLTSNGYLSGRKNYVSAGIYYSNKYITRYGQLEYLDKYLASKIDDENSFCPPSNLFNYGQGNGYAENIQHIRDFLHQFTFSSGFHERRVYKKGYFSRTLMDLQHIYYSRKNKG